jgi:hypothetical protein
MNLGCGFKINFSKSGVGYSCGGKGFRYTKTAAGRNRTTSSIPGTGLSYVNESGKKRIENSTDTQTIHYQNQNDFPSAHSIENAGVERFAPAQLQDFLVAIERYLTISYLLSCGIIFISIIFLIILSSTSESVIAIIAFVVFALMISMKFIHKFKGKVKAEYEYDEYGEKRIELIARLIDLLKQNDFFWQINEVSRNAQARKHGGAEHSVARFVLHLQEKRPAFLQTNARCYSIKLKKEKLYILPDKMLILHGRKIGVLDLKSLDIAIADTNLIEESAPQDASVVGTTWQFVNNNGTPDRRFKNNHQLFVCKYGTISFTSKEGFNTMIYCSNVSTAIEFSEILNTYKKEAE